MFDLVSILAAIEDSWVYLSILSFFAWYPLVSAGVLIVAAVAFYLRRERSPHPLPNPNFTPPVSVVISAYNEEAHIAQTLSGALEINYPDFEIVVIDDGSTDDTVGKVLPFVREGRVRLVRKLMNEGKAMALNDGIRCARGEILLIIDADAIPQRNILKYMVPHFESPRVGAVTGNPRVYNRRSLLCKLQAIEFTSIISLQRRAQRIWGRILTMSGVCGAFHRDAVYDVGMYSPDMATEDIDLSWKLQMRFWDIRYEPRSIVWMRVPETIGGLWRQRHRWAAGLAQVLRRHWRAIVRWKARRLWPVLAESVLSIIWAYCFVALTAMWILCYSIGYPPVGASPIPNWWGMLIGTGCLVQLAAGVLMDRRYDRHISMYYFAAVFYPLIYWILMAIVSSTATPGALLQSGTKRGPVRWKPVERSS